LTAADDDTNTTEVAGGTKNKYKR